MAGEWDVVGIENDPWAVAGHAPVQGVGSTFLGRVAHGIADPIYGLAQKAANFGGVNPLVDSLAAQEPEKYGAQQNAAANAVNRAVSERDKNYNVQREKAGSVGFDWGDALGNLISPPNLALGAISGGTTWPQLIGRGILSGAALSSAQPISGAKTPADMSTAALEQAGAGGAIGGISAGIIGGRAPEAGTAGKPANAPGVVPAIGRALRGATAPLTGSGRQVLAGQVLQDVGGNFKPEGLPLEGLQVTPGQRANNPGLMYLEDVSSQRTPTAINETAVRQGTNNRVIQNAITSLGDQNADAPTRMSDALERAYAAAKARTGQAWKAAGVDQMTGVPKNWIQGRVNNYVSGLKTAERNMLPAGVLDTLEQIPNQNVDMGEIQAWRSQLSDELRTASRAGQDNKARVIGGLLRTADGLIDELPEMGANQPNAEQLAAYKAARGATRQLKQTYTQPTPVRSALSVNSYGEDRLPVSATADTFIRSGKGAPEALNSYLNAITVDGKLDPGGVQAARNAFSQKFLDTVTSNAQPDINGVAPIAAPKVRAFVDNFQHVIDSPILTSDQRDLVNRIAKATDMVGRSARAQTPGSQTYARLAGEKYLDALIGPAASKLMPLGSAAVGAAAGSMMGPIEAFSGAVAAGLGEDKVSGVLYGAARDKVMDVLDEAIKNPEVAKTLMQKSGSKVAPGILGRIRGIIGASPYPASILAGHLLGTAPQGATAGQNYGP
jgi:hypothetical protein